MGIARRWLKALLGMKKEKDPLELPNSTTNTTRPGDRKDKRRWSFSKSLKDASPISHVPANLPPNVSPADSAWLRSYLAETEKEQNKHAIAVAAATAAAADAAVAAAQAAVAVVRLTSKGGCGGDLFGKRERWAAMRIQTVFRGYLARKAHRALRGLVKLQALVRGFLVRKRAAATLHGMQALIRAQTSVRYQRARRSFNKENRFLPESRPRKSIERFDEARSEFYSKRLSATYEPSLNGLDESPKIVEIDTFRTRSRSRRYNTVLSEYGEDVPYTSSPLPCPIPTRITVPGGQQLQDCEWYFTADECKFTTAHSTPRLASSFRSNAPSTPAKSVCGDSFFQPYSNCPNYMSSTKSFKAKSRSHSAPKQRPEPLPRKRLSLDEILAARNSVSGIRMHRPYNQVQEEVLNY